MTGNLKIFVKRTVSLGGCCGEYAYTREERAAEFPDEQDNLCKLGKLLQAVQDRYGKKVDVTVIDPQNFAALWDAFRYRINLRTPAVVLNGKKIFQRLPEVQELEQAIDAVLEG
ncbi:MAG: thioredoxin family protein [Spirochaetales bacterium]|jgi:hypothetical protein|nr:thioredoxin family protein [Spirochaetales bacterium]